MEQPDAVAVAVELVRRALVVTVQIALPMLGMGLIVGLVISILQAATQVQEQTLAFIPKMFAVVATLFLILPWITLLLIEYSEELLLNVHRWFGG